MNMSPDKSEAHQTLGLVVQHTLENRNDSITNNNVVPSTINNSFQLKPRLNIEDPKNPFNMNLDLKMVVSKREVINRKHRLKTNQASPEHLSSVITYNDESPHLMKPQLKQPSIDHTPFIYWLPQGPNPKLI